MHNFFITDDNLARNQNWEAIFDRLIRMREEEGLRIRIVAQVDTMAHKIRGFIAKAAGPASIACSSVWRASIRIR